MITRNQLRKEPALRLQQVSLPAAKKRHSSHTCPTHHHYNHDTASPAPLVDEPTWCTPPVARTLSRRVSKSSSRRPLPCPASGPKYRSPPGLLFETPEIRVCIYWLISRSPPTPRPPARSKKSTESSTRIASAASQEILPYRGLIPPCYTKRATRSATPWTTSCSPTAPPPPETPRRPAWPCGSRPPSAPSGPCCFEACFKN